MVTFGDRLRSFRLAAGLSQAELAADGLSASYISLLEAGKRTPSPEVVSQLALRLGCSPSQLSEGKPSERDDRISLELAFGRLAVEHGESAEARRRLEQLLEDPDLSERIRDEATYHLGVACDRSGDLSAAIRTFLPLYERVLEGRSHLLVTVVGLSLCGCYQDVGDFGRAVEVGESALVAARAQGLSGTDEYFRLAATAMWTYVQCGDWTHAQIWAEQLLADARTEGSRAGQGALYWNLGLLASRQGDIPRALKLYEHALGRIGELDNDRDFARLRAIIAKTLLAGDPPRAEEAVGLLERCAVDVRDLCTPDERAQWHWLMAVALLHRGDVVGAEAQANQALEFAGESSVARADALEALGDVLAAQGRDDDALEAWRESFRVRDAIALTRSVALSWRGLAERLAQADPALAAMAFRRALGAANVRDLSVAHRRQVALLRTRPPVAAE